MYSANSILGLDQGEIQLFVFVIEMFDTVYCFRQIYHPCLLKVELLVLCKNVSK
jgi:hypothetical protein